MRTDSEILSDIENYLKLLNYTYSLGGPMYLTHTTLIKCIRDYIEFARVKS
jgi:hypothetical protein